MSLSRVLLATALAALAVCPAAAQSMDYDALQSFFGEPVTSSATGAPQKVSQSPVDMEIITQDDIRRSGATDIPGALRFVAGIDERSYGVLQSEVGLRGYNQPLNPRLLVLLNGQQLYLDDYGEMIWANIPVRLEEIRQIEIIKGPNSALYGFNAGYGVINIVTYDPMKDNLYVASLRGGTFGYSGGSLVGTAQGQDAGVRISLGGDRVREFTGAQDYLAGNPMVRARDGTVNLDGKAQITPRVQMFGSANVTDSRSVTNEGYSFSDVFVRTNSGKLGVTADTALGLLSFDGYRNEEHYSDLPSYGALHAQTWVLQGSDVLKVGDTNTVRVSGEYRNDWLYQPGSMIGYEIYAGSVMWNWQIAPGLALTNSVRLDHVQLHQSGQIVPGSGFTQADYESRTLNALSFNSGLVWNVTTRDTLRFFAARGVQIPSLWDLGVQQRYGGDEPYSLSGNPFLKPTSVLNLGVAYDHAMPQLFSKLSVSLFVQRSDNIYVEPSSTPGVTLADGSTAYTAANVGYGTAAGAELRLSGSLPSGLRWKFSYAYATTGDHTNTDVGAIPTSYEDFGLSTPRHVLIGQLGDSWGRWEADAQVRWQSGYRDFVAVDQITLQRYLIGNYVTANARLAYHVTQPLTLALTAEQFNTAQLVEVAGPPVDRHVILSATFHF